LDKNRAEAEEKDELKSYLNMQIKERESEVIALQEELKGIKIEKGKEIKLLKEIEQFQSQTNLLWRNKSEAEMKSVELLEEIKNLEDELKLAKKIQKDERERASDMKTENERFRTEIQELKTKEDDSQSTVGNLMKQIKRLKDEQEEKEKKSALPPRSNSPPPTQVMDADHPLTTTMKNMENQIQLLKEENLKIKHELDMLEEEKHEMLERIDRLCRANEDLIQIQTEEREILRSRSNSISELALSLEEKASQGFTMGTPLQSENRTPQPKESRFTAYFRIVFGGCCG